MSKRFNSIEGKDIRGQIITGSPASSLVMANMIPPKGSNPSTGMTEQKRSYKKGEGSSKLSGGVKDLDHDGYEEDEEDGGEEGYEANQNDVSRTTVQKLKQGPTTLRANKWVPNDMYEDCKICKAYFNLVRRKHHCRQCGGLVCYNCSTRKEYVSGYADERVRVCDMCYRKIRKLKNSRHNKWSILSSYFTSGF